MFEFQQGGLLCKNICLFCGTAPFLPGLLTMRFCPSCTVSVQRKSPGPGAPTFSVPEIPQRSWGLCCPAPLLIQEDLWGHRNILSKCNTGDFFGEPYAATPGAILNISVVAEEDCEILLLNVKRLLTSCPTACDHHQKLIRNLVSVLANKILLFNDKITHVSKRTTREKLLSYLSAESIRQSSLSFDIPFDRQQLADFLCVERAAMSAELSKLQKEGLLVTKRNHFQLLTH